MPEQRFRIVKVEPHPAEPDQAFAVFDKGAGTWAMLPDATLCWRLTGDRALDAYNELTGGRRAERRHA